MTAEELKAIRELADMKMRDLRLLVGSDDSVRSRLQETQGWTRGDLIEEAIERGLTTISPYIQEDQLS